MDGNKQNVLLLMGGILIVFIACMGTVSADSENNNLILSTDDFIALSGEGNTCKETFWIVPSLYCSGVPTAQPAPLTRTLDLSAVDPGTLQPLGSAACIFIEAEPIATVAITFELHGRNGILEPSIPSSGCAYAPGGTSASQCYYVQDFSTYGLGEYQTVAKITRGSDTCNAYSDWWSVYNQTDTRFTPTGEIWVKEEEKDYKVTFTAGEDRNPPLGMMAADTCKWTIKDGTTTISESNGYVDCRGGFEALFPNTRPDSKDYSVTLIAKNNTVPKVESTPRTETITIIPIGLKITPSTTSPKPGETVAFTGDIDWLPPNTAHFEWDFGNGRTYPVPSDFFTIQPPGDSTLVAYMDYDLPKIYTVTLTLFQNLGGGAGVNPYRKITASLDLLVADLFPDIKYDLPQCKTMSPEKPLEYSFYLEYPSSGQGVTIPDGGCKWDFGDGKPQIITNPCPTKANPLKYPYGEPGQYPITVLMTNTTFNLIDIPVKKTIDPETDGVIYADFEYFPKIPRRGDTIEFRNNSTNSVGLKWELNPGDGSDNYSGTISTSTDFLERHKYEADGPFEITLKIWPPQSGCGPTSYKEWIYLGQIKAAFEWRVVELDGPRFVVEFTDTSIPQELITEREWEFDGQTFGTGGTAIYTFPAYGEYPVKLTINGDKTTTGIVKLDSRKPLIWTDDGIKVDGGIEIKAGTRVTFNGHSPVFSALSADSDEIEKWKWEWYIDSAFVGEGKVFTYPFDTPNTPPGKPYNVVLHATDEDGVVAISDPFKVWVWPDIGFKITENPVKDCTDFFPDVEYSLKASINHGSVKNPKFTWTLPNNEGTLADTDTIAYTFKNKDPQKFRVEVRDGDTIIGRYSQPITAVGNILGFTFTPDPPKELDSNTKRVDVTFTGTCSVSTGGPCIPEIPDPFGWKWNFANGMLDSGRTVTSSYSTAGTYDVILTAENSCGTGYHPDTITIREKLEADFTYDYASSGNPLEIQFTSTSLGGPTHYQWRGDAQHGWTSQQQNPTQLYPGPGDYEVTLTIGRDGAQANSITLPVSLPIPGPKPDLTPKFKAEPMNGPVPLTVYFTDLTEPSGNVLGWEWDFGDGTFSDEKQPDPKIYTQRQTYTVSLRVWNGDKWFGPYQQRITAGTPQDLTPNFFVDRPTTTGLAPFSVHFMDDTTPKGEAVRWEWFFYDGTGSHKTTEPYITHTFNNPGIYDVRMIAYNGAEKGFPVTKSKLIDVGMPITADFVTSRTQGSLPLTVQFTDTSTGSNIDSWEWNFGPQHSSSSLRNPRITFTDPGTYPVRLTASSSKYQSSDTKSMEIDIIQHTGPVTASFTADPAIGQAPLFVAFTDTSAGYPDVFEWEFGDGETSTARNPGHLFKDPGRYRVILTAKNSATGDYDQYYDWIRVTSDGLPDVQFEAKEEEKVGAAPFTVCFTDQTNTGNPEFEATSWLWSFGDGTNSLQQNPCHTYRNPGLYTVTLEAKNAQGVGQII
ncbi:MAG: PKD domain-containing protein, partial [Euryarchaeota archaeon]|nr:PKD domain-containing protein [Euryarchaeota archaeon]